MEIQSFIKIFADAVEIDDVESLTIDTRFRDLDEWSSLAAMILVAELEKCGVKIIGTDIRNCVTIGDIYKLTK